MTLSIILIAIAVAAVLLLFLIVILVKRNQSETQLNIQDNLSHTMDTDFNKENGEQKSNATYLSISKWLNTKHLLIIGVIIVFVCSLVLVLFFFMKFK